MIILSQACSPPLSPVTLYPALPCQPASSAACVCSANSQRRQCSFNSSGLGVCAAESILGTGRRVRSVYLTVLFVCVRVWIEGGNAAADNFLSASSLHVCSDLIYFTMIKFVTSFCFRGGLVFVAPYVCCFCIISPYL